MGTTARMGRFSEAQRKHSVRLGKRDVELSMSKVIVKILNQEFGAFRWLSDSKELEREVSELRMWATTAVTLSGLGSSCLYMYMIPEGEVT